SNSRRTWIKCSIAAPEKIEPEILIESTQPEAGIVETFAKIIKAKLNEERKYRIYRDLFNHCDRTRKM
ncbi:1530_t:CDS:1, partial [Funneliformis mosseae]